MYLHLLPEISTYGWGTVPGAKPTTTALLRVGNGVQHRYIGTVFEQEILI
jgi:hypothetical protein